MPSDKRFAPSINNLGGGRDVQSDWGYPHGIAASRCQREQRSDKTLRPHVARSSKCGRRAMNGHAEGKLSRVFVGEFLDLFISVYPLPF